MTSEKRNGESAGVRAVQRALDILSCFTVDAPHRGVSEIAEETGLSKGAVHRLLAALKSRRCVDSDPVSGKYQLGTKLLEFAGVLYANRLSYQEKARPHLQRLVEEINETVVVNALDGDTHICTLVIDATRPFRFFTRPGVRRPPHFGAAGQVLLAWQSEETVEKILPTDKLEGFTLWSITRPEDYLRRLRQVREQGYALDKGETFQDVTGLSAPIYDHNAEVVAAATIVAPTHRVPDDRIPVLIERLLRATARISIELGMSPALLRRDAGVPAS